MAGCSAPAPRGPCEGLVYTDAGLTPEQYAPCAKAMVARLDVLWDDLQSIHNKTLSKADRLRARQHCLATTSELARMWNQAGGTSKLVSMAWADTDWNRFNYDVVRVAHVLPVDVLLRRRGAGRRRTIEAVHVEARRFVARLR